ncbi:hypothetical protein EK21DRAFT_112877 [Setomelanomma holmii]|uniref:Uncharacterized protein n=1 Tax=Setomelanomma holmii TaxID=210430 RepID=A0A9P4LN29_9PLEO|nr:hypothetical protein EK21DRAFT_112877 [Setomelanomma holmii]
MYWSSRNIDQGKSSAKTHEFNEFTLDPVDPVAEVTVTKAKNKRKRKLRKIEPFAMHTKHELEPYHHYPRVYGEVNYARKFRQQTKSFDVTPVIRVKIYRYALKFDSPLELWAESDTSNHTYWVRQDNKDHLRNILKRRLLNLSLLRTCRKVHAEASEVFYSENEFGFTGLNGTWSPTSSCGSSTFSTSSTSQCARHSVWAEVGTHGPVETSDCASSPSSSLVTTIFGHYSTNEDVWAEMKDLLDKKPDLEIDILRMGQ